MSKVTLNPVKEKEETIKYGDLFKWAAKSSNKGVCYLCYECLLSLEEPNSTWHGSGDIFEYIKVFLNNGSLVKLPKGYSVTIEQE